MDPKPIFIHVPKTGGNTITRIFDVVRNGHQTAEQTRAKDPAAWEASWKFAFIRDPWDRMVSWYWWRAREWATPEDFSAWAVSEDARTLDNPNRSARKMLADTDGNLLVDHVYRFERFPEALEDLTIRLGAPPLDREVMASPTTYKPAREVRANVNIHKEAKLGRRDVRELYTPEARDLVARLCAWEIETFGYEF
jgi:hypothetical protein